MYDLDIYNNSEELLLQQEEKIYIKFIIVSVAIISVLISLCFIKYPKIYYFEGFVKDDQIILYLDTNSLSNLKGDKIIINKKETAYKIENIEIINNSNYYMVTISVKEKLLKNMVSLKIEDEKTNLYNEIIRKIWRGFGNE